MLGHENAPSPGKGEGVVGFPLYEGIFQQSSLQIWASVFQSIPIAGEMPGFVRGKFQPHRRVEEFL